ncbi:hypothetical protein HPB47_027897, partial [Ixodes persulcatus]
AIYVDVGTSGRTHDSTTFKKRTFYKGLVENSLKLPTPEPLLGAQCAQPFVFVAYAAFPIGENQMRPYPGQAKQPVKIYNYRHSRARRVSENFFGVLAQRFPILLRPIQALPQNVTTLVLACCGLHNMLRDEGVDTDMKPEKASDGVTQHNEKTANRFTELHSCLSSRAGTPDPPILVVTRRSELADGVRVQACGSSCPRSRCVGKLLRAITTRVSLRKESGIVMA